MLWPVICEELSGVAVLYLIVDAMGITCDDTCVRLTR